MILPGEENHCLMMEKTMGPVHERIHIYWLSGGIVMLAPSFVGARIEMC
jgi:hypothetical protein